jgi:hypothetical protein
VKKTIKEDRVLHLTKIEKVNPAQIKFGIKLGLDISDCSTSVALAKINDAIDTHFNNISDLGHPTERQISFALEMGYEITNRTKREGFAVVDDILIQLNLDTIEEQQLCPGTKVINIYSPDQIETISSIKKDGTCYLRGGNGKRAWARNLKRIDDND